MKLNKSTHNVKIKQLNMSDLSKIFNAYKHALDSRKALYDTHLEWEIVEGNNFNTLLNNYKMVHDLYFIRFSKNINILESGIHKFHTDKVIN